MDQQAWTRNDSTILEFVESNPHKVSTAAHAKYEQIEASGTVGEAKAKGASMWELAEYFKKGSLRILEVAVPKMKGWGPSKKGLVMSSMMGKGVGMKGGGGGEVEDGKGKIEEEEREKRGRGGGGGKEKRGEIEGGGEGGKDNENKKKHEHQEVSHGGKHDHHMTAAASSEGHSGSALKPSSKHIKLDPGIVKKMEQVKQSITPVRQLNFSMATPVSQQHAGFPFTDSQGTEEGTEGSRRAISLQDFGKMLDEKLAPINSYIRDVDARIQEMSAQLSQEI